MIIFYIVLASFVLWILFRFNYRKRELKHYQIALTDSFGEKIKPLPNLKITNSYGYPHFEIIFKNKILLEKAKNDGLTEHFIDRINDIHSSFKEFDAESAVHFTWDGRTYTIITPN